MEKYFKSEVSRIVQPTTHSMLACMIVVPAIWIHVASYLLP